MKGVSKGFKGSPFYFLQCKLIIELMLPDRYPVFHVDLDVDFQSSDNRVPSFAHKSSQELEVLRTQSNVTTFSTIGQRKDNLDRFAVAVRKQFTFMAVFDGHSDPAPVNYVQAALPQKILEHPQLLYNPKLVLLQSFQQTQRQVIQKFDKGCTGLVALALNGRLIVANLGDSQLFGVDEQGAVKQLLSLHNLSNSAELMQVINRGGIVLKKGSQYRINGELNLSRCFGDRNLKYCLNKEPELYEFDVSSYRRWVLATDGFCNAEGAAGRANIVDFTQLMGQRSVYKDNATALYYQP